MQLFLQHVAHDLHDKVGGDFRHTTVVFPNKRAALFFNRYLWERSGGRVMWTPHYTTISELFDSMSDTTVGDPVYLVCMLHEAYRRHVVGDDRSMDEIYPLLEMMLADFQDVDSNMVPADKMFRNIGELHEMTDYSFLEPEQIEAIRHFFNGLDWQQGTKEQRRFATLWESLLPIYLDYKKMLLAQTEPAVYEGMLKREVAEALARPADSERMLSRLTSEHYAFVGFNVLNRTEKALFDFVKQNRHTYFYWDYDAAFMPHTADAQLAMPGTFISENIHDFGTALQPDDAIYHTMRQRPKRITFIQSSTENAQARYVGKWVAKHLGADCELTDCAVVLCNENLLQPVLHSIPPSVGEGDARRDMALNVTMGCPLSSTPAYSLAQVLLELQLRGRTPSGAWRYKQVAAVLKHPYVRRMSNGRSNATLARLAAANVIFPTDAAFADDALLGTIFTRQQGKQLTAWLASVLAMASQSLCTADDKTVQSQQAALSDDNQPDTADGSRADFDTQLYKESIFATYTAVNRLHAMQESIAALAQLSDHTVARLVYQALQRVAVPFHGEPADGMQVMGFLETRNLDFKHVVLLSADEAQMPRASKRPSLIPYSLQMAFGMTTIDKEVSIYAYYFYRLFARAESVTVVWNASTDDGQKGEMSRFMMQMMVESGHLFHPDQSIELKQFTTPVEAMKAESLSVEKTPAILRRLHERFDIATEQTDEWQDRHADDGYMLILSPSAINTYLRCQMQFFFKYVARLRPDDDVSEDIDDAIFGDIFHYAMEHLYTPYTGQPLTSSRLKAMANDTATLRQLVDEGFMTKLYKIDTAQPGKRTSVAHIKYSGSQLIKHHVLRSLLRMQLLADADTAAKLESTGGSLTVMATEEKHCVVREIKPKDGTPFNVRLGGIIDRIDLIDNGSGQQTIRIVDYKTSTNPQTATDVPQLFDSKKASSCYHITQTLYYCDVLYDEAECPDTRAHAYEAHRRHVVPAIMYYKNNCRNISPVVRLNDSRQEHHPKTKPFVESYADDCRDTFHPLITAVIEQIFSPGTFTANPDDHNCAFCDFRQLCRKTAKKLAF